MPEIESIPTHLCKVICRHQCKLCYLPDEVVDASQVKAVGEHIQNELNYIFQYPDAVYSSEAYLISGATLLALKETAEALIKVTPHYRVDEAVKLALKREKCNFFRLDKLATNHGN